MNLATMLNEAKALPADGATHTLPSGGKGIHLPEAGDMAERVYVTPYELGAHGCIKRNGLWQARYAITWSVATNTTSYHMAQVQQ